MIFFSDTSTDVGAEENPIGVQIHGCGQSRIALFDQSLDLLSAAPRTNRVTIGHKSFRFAQFFNKALGYFFFPLLSWQCITELGLSRQHQEKDEVKKNKKAVHKFILLE